MKAFRKSKRGFSLVEVALALGVASFCLIPLVALLPLGLSSNQSASSQVAAAGLLRAIAADLKATPQVSSYNTITNSPLYGFKIPDSSGTTVYVDDAGNYSSSLSAQSRYRIRVTTVAQPSSATDKSVTLQRIQISWPANSGKTLGSLDSIIALDRN